MIVSSGERERAADRDRTGDRPITNRELYQLSYRGVSRLHGPLVRGASLPRTRLADREETQVHLAGLEPANLYDVNVAL